MNGEKVYAVHQDSKGNLTVESAEVVKRTEKQVKLNGRAGLAFHCRKIFAADDMLLSPTPSDAIRRAIQSRQRNVAVWLQNVRDTEVEIANLKKMLAKEVAKEQ